MPLLAVTLGDPNGVGPELVWQCWRAMRGGPVRLWVFGDPDVIATLMPDAAVLTLTRDPLTARHCAPDALAVYPTEVACPKRRPGVADPATAPMTIAAIEQAVGLALSGVVDGVVTMPIAKSVLAAAGFGFPGHTEFIAHLCAGAARDGPTGPVMMLASRDLNVALATIHTPLRAVAEALSVDRLHTVAAVVDHALRTRFKIASPRLAFAGLNPHAGEDGLLGDEERRIINPAAAKARAGGIDITDAQPADTLFHAEARARYDAVIAMYHDQGLIPIKTIAFWEAVNVTLGLPIIRTSPDHGVGYDIAGKGVARADSALAAMHLAATMSRHTAADRHG